MWCSFKTQWKTNYIQNEKDLSNNVVGFFSLHSPTPHFWTSLIEEEPECQGVKDLSLPIVANYLANPPFPYVYTEESIPDSLAESQNESASTSSASQCETSPCSSATQVESIRTPTSCNSEDDFPALDAAEQLPALSATIAAPKSIKPEVQNGPVCQPPLPHSRGLFSPVASKQAVPLQSDSSPTGPAPTFQPFFFTGTFPYNMQGNEE